jgi:hypothetical protein
VGEAKPARAPKAGVVRSLAAQSEPVSRRSQCPCCPTLCLGHVYGRPFQAALRLAQLAPSPGTVSTSWRTSRPHERSQLGLKDGNSLTHSPSADIHSHKVLQPEV